MKKNNICQICKKKINSNIVNTRSKKKLEILNCKDCDFDFFLKEKNSNLKKNKLDSFRLKNAGLQLIEKKKDISNGLKQAKEYIKAHIKTKKKLKILDIGCSWGYFLKECKNKGHNVYGLEINKIRNKYVNNKLKIKCLNNIDEIQNFKFDKIFLFYSLEYIKNPQEYLISLKNILELNGEIIIYTPNKNDHINQILNLKDYRNFFYEENSVNYFSERSLTKIGKNIKSKFKIKLNQGYSIVNFLNWYFHKKPFNTGFIGKDYYIDDLEHHLKINSKLDILLKKKLTALFKEFNNEFKKLIIQNNISNTIIFKIKW